MSEEYTLVRDIVYDHNERMLNIKKYYPFFKLIDVSFSQIGDGKYDNLDMGYILMAVLRFFIEENNFREKLVSYNEYSDFMKQVIKRDFDLSLSNDEQKEIIGYIFDKLKNDGKPFTYEYYDPISKKKHTVRVKIIDNKIIDDTVLYFITSDAIEFYLDTKEIKDESNITIAQVLLGKMISTKNFRGGAEVVARINNEVSKLISRKNEILNILSFDVFEGIKAYEDFVNTGVKWFSEEQKLFQKNKELIDKALRAGESDNKYFEAMDDIYHLENELNRAIRKHGELLNACTSLQKKTDEIITNAKISRLRSSLDFRKIMSNIMQKDNTDLLELFIKPLLKLRVKKAFSPSILDNLLLYRQDNEEDAEKVNVSADSNIYKFDDEIEEERINNNYCIIIKILFTTLLSTKEFDLVEFNNILEKECGKQVFNNADYYSFMVHLCQKSEYRIQDIITKPDTFLELIIQNVVKINEDYIDLKFNIEFEDNVLNMLNNEVVNIKFTRR